MRCLCHSDDINRPDQWPALVSERMNNARPHYTYCGDDVNPSSERAPVMRLRRCWRRVEYCHESMPTPHWLLCSLVAHSARFCLNNSSRAARWLVETHGAAGPHYALRCVADSLEDCWPHGAARCNTAPGGSDLSNRSLDSFAAGTTDRQKSHEPLHPTVVCVAAYSLDWTMKPSRGDRLSM